MGRRKRMLLLHQRPPLLPSPPFPPKLKNKANGSCSGSPPTESICLPPSSLSWTKPHSAGLQFNPTAKSGPNLDNVYMSWYFLYTCRTILVLISCIMFLTNRSVFGPIFHFAWLWFGLHPDNNK